MGCGASKDPKVAVADSQKQKQNYNSSSRNYNNQNGFKQVELKNTQDSYNQYNRPSSEKKPLAFVIEFDEKKKSGNIVNRPPPGRLQLEPIKKGSANAQEKLDEKMRLAEKNRENILRNRVKSSKNRGSAQSRNNSGSLRDGSSYYNNDSRKMSRDNDSFYNDNGYRNQNISPPNMQRSEQEENRNRERLLNRRRIVPNPTSDDEIEHNKRYSDDDTYF